MKELVKLRECPRKGLIKPLKSIHHFLCGQTAFLRVRLGKCLRHWIVLLNGSKLHQGPVSYILLQRGGRIPVFFCFLFFLFVFFFLPGSLSKGFALFGFHSAASVNKFLLGLCTVDTSCSRIARIRKLRCGGDVGKGVCLTCTDRYRNYDYMKAGISTNERPNEWIDE